MHYRNKGTALLYEKEEVTAFSFWPNYTRDFMVYWEWLTDVLTSYEGVEQRRGLRRYPRCTYEYEVFASLEDRAALANTLLVGQTKTTLAIVWTEEMLLPSRMDSEAANTLAISNRYFTKGGFIVCLLSPSHYEIRQIVDIINQKVVLDSEVAWVEGSPLYPAMPARMNKQQVLDQVTPTYSTAIITLNCFPLEVELYALNPFPVFLNFPVVEEVLDWGRGEKVTADYRVQLIDNKTGRPAFDVLGGIAEVSIDTHWFLPSDRLTKFLRFIHYCKGRLRPFWFPTGTQDMLPVAISEKGELVVTDAGFHSSGGVNTGRKFLRIETTCGVFYLKIAQVFYIKITGREFITLYNEEGNEYTSKKGSTPDTTPYIPLPFSLLEISMVSFLVLARLDVDRIEIAYKTPTYATSLLPIRTLINEL
jgi:hypothetical protein